MVTALRSSSGLGRLPPQVRNTGSNPVRNAVTMSSETFAMVERMIANGEVTRPEQVIKIAALYSISPACNAQIVKMISAGEINRTQAKMLLTELLPSSSGLGRQPPQAGNIGSNPVGSAITINRCPWSGVECNCKEFPWLEDSCVPRKCGDVIKEKAPAMLAFRKLAKETTKCL